MNFRYLSRKIGSFALAILFLSGIMFFSTTTADAQRRGWSGRRVVVVRPARIYNPYRYNRPYGWYGNGLYSGWYDTTWYNPYSQYIFDNSQEAADSAYRQGYKTGEEDGRKKKSYSYERSHYYREAGFGNFGEVYRRSFSQGYQSGYDEGRARAS